MKAFRPDGAVDPCSIVPAGSNGSVTIEPASVGQRLLWVLQRHRASGALNMPVIARVRSPLDRDTFRRAVDALVARHDALRTVVEWRDRGVVRRVFDSGSCPVTFTDLRTAPDAEAAVRSAIKAETAVDIDARALPMRVHVWQLHDTDHVVCLTVHHFAMDGWSAHLLLRDLAALYRGETLPRVEWQYSDFVRWQTAELERHAGEHARYWAGQLRGAMGMQFPERADGRSGAATAMELLPLPDDAVRALGDIARAERMSLFGAFLAVFFATARVEMSRDDLAVTTLLSDRTRPELANTVGYFISAMVLRVRLGGEPTFRGVLRECRSALFGAVEHQALPFHLLQPGVVDRSLRVDDLAFQMMSDASMTYPPFEPWEMREPGRTDRTFALEFVVLPLYGRWYVSALFTPQRFTPDWVRGFLAAFVEMTGRVMESPDAVLSSTRSR